MIDTESSRRQSLSWKENLKAYSTVLLKEKWTIIALTALFSSFHYFGWLQAFETPALDKLLRLKTPLEPRFTRVVAINEDDYHRGPPGFEGRSPLDTHRLIAVIDAIAAANPKLIAVDIDTSGQQWKDAKDRFANGPIIVWAEDLEYKSTPDARPQSRGALANTHPPYTGVAAMTVDWDNVVRRYNRIVPASPTPKPSFAWKVVTTAANILPATNAVDERQFAHLRATNLKIASDSEPVILSFAGSPFDFAPISAENTLNASHGSGWKNGPLTGKIVLLGQEHHAARDDHVTPIGLLSGVRLLAQTIECELQGLVVTPFSHIFVAILDVLGAAILLAMTFFFHRRFALWLTFATIVLFGFAGSYLVFRTITHWAAFVPVFIGVVVHHIYHRLHECENQTLNQGRFCH